MAHAGCVFKFEERLGDHAMDVVLCAAVRDVPIYGACWIAERSGGFKLSWADNADATRATKPQRAELHFSKDLANFGGECCYPSEGSIGWHGGITPKEHCRVAWLLVRHRAQRLGGARCLISILQR